MLVARMAPGLAMASSSSEHVLLDVHALEHRLDDQVAVGQGGEVGRAGEAGHAGLGLLRLGGAGALVVLADGADALVERLLLDLDHGHGDADVHEVHGDAAAHGAAADDADLLDRRSAGCRPARRGSCWPGARRRRRSAGRRDWEPVISSMNRVRSVFIPSSKGWFTAASMQRMLYSGARKPRNLRALALRKLAKISGWPRAASTLSLQVADLLERPALGGDACGRRRRRLGAAGPRARSRRPGPSPGTPAPGRGGRWSSSPAPSRRRRRAAGAGCRRRRAGGRGSPPAGRTSPRARRRGSGRRAPPPARRPAPCRGWRRPPAWCAFSMAVCTSNRLAPLGAPPNSVMSAPAMKVRPSQTMTIALAPGSARPCLTPSARPSRTFQREGVHRRRVDGDDADVPVELIGGDVVDGGHGARFLGQVSGAPLALGARATSSPRSLPKNAAGQMDAAKKRQLRREGSWQETAGAFSSIRPQLAG